MPCDPFVLRDKDGNVTGSGVICSSRRSAPACVHCGARSSKLCDGPGARPGATCDRPLCSRCAIHVPPNSDYCREHRDAARTAAAQLRLFDQGDRS